MEKTIYVDAYKRASDEIENIIIPIEIRDDYHCEKIPQELTGEDALLVLDVLMRNKIISNLRIVKQNINDFYNR